MITSVEMLTTPLRTVKAKVELYNGSTLANTFRYNDDLIKIQLERTGESGKFFGFGIIQKAVVNIRDINRAYNAVKGDAIKVYLGADDMEIDYNTSQPYFPTFYIEDVKRDEKTNELTITAYDALYSATGKTIGDISLYSEGYSLHYAITVANDLLGLEVAPQLDYIADYDYPAGANIEGSETVKEILNAAAEMTQSIYYIDGTNTLVFKPLDYSGASVLRITKADYMELTSEDSRTLAAICSATELGDNIIAESGLEGETQYIRDNPFLELREDVETILATGLDALAGATITPFTLKWRGNYLLECGDKIEIETKDGNYISSYIITDSMTYKGGFSQNTSWEYSANSAESANNPATLGKALKQTYARVDKANKQIEIVASETSANSEAVSSLQLNTESISASVSSLQQTTADTIEGVNTELANLKKTVESSVTSEQVSLQIKQELTSGADKVITTTGFKFDDSGLTINKSGSEMKTQITEDGMLVFRDNTEVLTADNVGVKATNLHATTYLIIGTNSRFENYGNNRTGCFWIGG